MARGCLGKRNCTSERDALCNPRARIQDYGFRVPGWCLHLRRYCIQPPCPGPGTRNREPCTLAMGLHSASRWSFRSFRLYFAQHSPTTRPSRRKDCRESIHAFGSRLALQCGGSCRGGNCWLPEAAAHLVGSRDPSQIDKVGNSSVNTQPGVV